VIVKVIALSAFCAYKCRPVMKQSHCCSIFLCHMSYCQVLLIVTWAIIVTLYSESSMVILSNQISQGSAVNRLGLGDFFQRLRIIFSYKFDSESVMKISS